jgi:hypothetical protein
MNHFHYNTCTVLTDKQLQYHNYPPLEEDPSVKEGTDNDNGSNADPVSPRQHPLDTASVATSMRGM